MPSRHLDWPRSVPTTPAARQRGISGWGILFLVLLVAIFVGIRMLGDQTRQQVARDLADLMSKPDAMLRRFYIERSQDFTYKEKKWEILTQFMSSDDVEWFEQNKQRLATLSPQMGPLARVASEGEMRYGALEGLLRFGPGATRPVISRIHENGKFAVAYVHPPNAPQALAEVFLINENGMWKIRRFLGARDSSEVMEMLAEEKKANEEPLSSDEEAYLADKAGYRKMKRDGMLAEAGLTPTAKP